MENFKIKIEKEITVTQQDIDDIMDTALSGITYWCNMVEVVGDYLGEYASEQISRGGALKLYDAESDDVWVLTLEKLLHGIEKAYDGNWFMDYGWCDGSVIDTCQVDGDVADTIVQYALFDELVFG